MQLTFLDYFTIAYLLFIYLLSCFLTGAKKPMAVMRDYKPSWKVRLYRFLFTQNPKF